jgi:hypothetical protein
VNIPGKVRNIDGSQKPVDIRLAEDIGQGSSLYIRSSSVVVEEFRSVDQTRGPAICFVVSIALLIMARMGFEQAVQAIALRARDEGGHDGIGVVHQKRCGPPVDDSRWP